ncbi:MAG: hypothetical protein ABEJ95_05100 [Candidatus Nanohalobium sp.]
MKIGIDFDRVLFDTDSFNKYLKKHTGLHHVESDVYDRNGNYSPEKHAEACGIDVEEVYRTAENAQKFIYSDIEELEKLKPKHRLVLVTRGEQKLQEKKMEKTQVKQLFNEVHIIQEGSKDVDGIEFLVDDRKKEIEDAELPGMKFNREKHTAEDIVKQVRKIEG